MANVHCDECKKYFDIKLKEKKRGNGIVETYFICPHCDKHYTAFVTDAVVRRKQREIRSIHEMLKDVKTMGNIADFQKIHAEMEQKKQELQPLMSALKDKYGKG